jgi:hypothetical protein
LLRHEAQSCRSAIKAIRIVHLPKESRVNTETFCASISAEGGGEIDAQNKKRG